MKTCFSSRVVHPKQYTLYVHYIQGRVVFCLVYTLRRSTKRDYLGEILFYFSVKSHHPSHCRGSGNPDNEFETAETNKLKVIYKHVYEMKRATL